jgi:hypothetical protein
MVNAVTGFLPQNGRAYITNCSATPVQKLRDRWYWLEYVIFKGGKSFELTLYCKLNNKKHRKQCHSTSWFLWRPDSVRCLSWVSASDGLSACTWDMQRFHDSGIIWLNNIPVGYFCDGSRKYRIYYLCVALTLAPTHLSNITMCKQNGKYVECENVTIQRSILGMYHIGIRYRLQHGLSVTLLTCVRWEMAQVNGQRGAPGDHEQIFWNLTQVSYLKTGRHQSWSATLGQS